MTIRQKAYNLIDRLPDESVAMLVSLMMLLPKKDVLSDGVQTELSEKQLAFRRMQDLREISKSYDLGDLEEEVGAALAEKYGSI